MIKSIEELNPEELLYVKNIARKYLQDCEQDDILADKRINMINELLKKNEKDIKKLQRKVEYLDADEDDFLLFFGVLCSFFLSVSIKDFADPTESLMIFMAGAISSYIANSSLNSVKEKAKMNIYKDLDDLENLMDKNEKLKFAKQKLLNYKSYQKELKNFVND